MNPQCQAVLFDAGQTLISIRQSVGHAYADPARKYGVIAEPASVDLAFRRIWEQRRDTLHESSSDALERQWWHGLVADVFSSVGKLDDFGGAFDLYFDELSELFRTPETWRVFEDVAPALDMLDRLGIRRAVVSNWDSSLPRLLDTLELRHRFEFVLTSAEAGHRKPDPRIFEQAVARLGLAPEHVLHVGDSYEDDFAGAQAARLKPVIIDRDGLSHRCCPTMRTLAELPRWLDGPSDVPG